MVTKYLIAAPAVWKRSRKRIKSGNNVDRAKRPPENTAMKGDKAPRLSGKRRLTDLALHTVVRKDL